MRRFFSFWTESFVEWKRPRLILKKTNRWRHSVNFPIYLTFPHPLPHILFMSKKILILMLVWKHRINQMRKSMRKTGAVLHETLMRKRIWSDDDTLLSSFILITRNYDILIKILLWRAFRDRLEEINNGKWNDWWIRDNQRPAR